MKAAGGWLCAAAGRCRVNQRSRPARSRWRRRRRRGVWRVDGSESRRGFSVCSLDRVDAVAARRGCCRCRVQGGGGQRRRRWIGSAEEAGARVAVEAYTIIFTAFVWCLARCSAALRLQSQHASSKCREQHVMRLPGRCASSIRSSRHRCHHQPLCRSALTTVAVAALEHLHPAPLD